METKSSESQRIEAIGEIKIEFLFDISKDLKDLALKVEKMAESTKNYSIEIGEALGIKLPSTSVDLQSRA
jgi:hypothetical protein